MGVSGNDMGTLEGMSPIAYLRVVRLRRAHWDLRAADPSHDSVASIARRWGFAHLGRFAAAHKNMYGQTPLQALRAALFAPSARAFGVPMPSSRQPTATANHQANSADRVAVGGTWSMNYLARPLWNVRIKLGRACSGRVRRHPGGGGPGWARAM
ncbi:MAG: hypothetical protein QOI25_5006 [Mycobacterium sp.]|jgi:AraC-like DNA-binding protein|nr:hypothetical protein [Mycobacterium sp.]